jgi:hypothetical protein
MKKKEKELKQIWHFTLNELCFAKLKYISLPCTCVQYTKKAGTICLCTEVQQYTMQTNIYYTKSFNSCCCTYLNLL